MGARWMGAAVRPDGKGVLDQYENAAAGSQAARVSVTDPAARRVAPWDAQSAKPKRPGDPVSTARSFRNDRFPLPRSWVPPLLIRGSENFLIPKKKRRP